MLRFGSVARGLRTALWALALATATATSADAIAADKRECFAAHEQGQIAQKARKLKAATAQFLVCSDEACPAMIRDECAKWLSETHAAMATVVPTARGRDGRDAAEVHVFVDGELLAERLSGGSFEVDPGEHEFRFVLADGTKIEQRFVVNEGETRRRIAVDFSSLPTAAPQASAIPAAPVVVQPTSRPIPVAVYVLGGLGVAALGSFTFFAISGKSKQNDLESGCAPRCADSEVAVMDHRYLAADISLGVGIVSLGAATWLLLSRRSQTSSAPSAWVDIAPSRGSAQVRWTTRF
jgi:hypothetical protein